MTAPAGFDHWQVVFDGGSLGNPGRGYGSYRLKPPGADWMPAVRREYGDRVTNNEAEYQTLTEALRDLAARAGDPRRVAVEVFGDSQLVIRQLEGAWKVRTASLLPYRDAAAAELKRFGATKLVWQRRDRSVALLGH